MVKVFVIGVLYDKGRCLAEERQEHQEHFPRGVVFPGGPIEAGESPPEALFREMKVRLGIFIESSHHFGSFYYKDGCYSEVYLIDRWGGMPRPLEARNLVWINKPDQLTSKFDRTIFRKIIKLLPKADSNKNNPKFRIR